MTLISCAECGKRISDLSNQCIGCGAPNKKQIVDGDIQKERVEYFDEETEYEL